MRPRPESDELFSSWLIRLAWANGTTASTLYKSIRPAKHHFEHDLDWSAEKGLLTAVGRATGLDYSVVHRTTLDTFNGRLFVRAGRSNPCRWILPTRVLRRRAQANGLQCCPDCLAEGDVLYFRQAWRLAFATTCPVHGRLLLDRCPACEHPLDFRTSPPALLGREASLQQMATCHDCGHDWRDLSFDPYDPGQVLIESGAFRMDGTWGWQFPEATKRVHEVASFQMRLHQALERGTYLLAGEAVPIAEFMTGLHQLIRLLSYLPKAATWRTVVSQSSNLPVTHLTQPTVRFANLRADARFRIMASLAWLINGWPHRFSQACEESDMIHSKLVSTFHGHAPWLLRETRRYDGLAHYPHLQKIAARSSSC